MIDDKKNVRFCAMQVKSGELEDHLIAPIVEVINNIEDDRVLEEVENSVDGTKSYNKEKDYSDTHSSVCT